jgi:hypothetical protein
MKEEQQEIELYKTYQTKAGNEVRIYAINCTKNGKVHGAIKSIFSEWDPWVWDKFGNCLLGYKNFDLVLKSE